MNSFIKMLTPRIFSLLLFTLHLCISSAQASVLIPHDTSSLPLRPYIEALEDPKGEITLKDIEQGNFEDKFHKISGTGDLNFGYTSSVYWLRLNLRTESINSWLLEIAYPSLDYVEFYTRNGNNLIKLTAGDHKPFSEKLFTHRNLVFPLTLSPIVEQTVYLRVHTKGSMTLPIKLWSQKALHENDQLVYTLFALYFGMLLALGLYNLLIYFSLKERIYLTYFAFDISLIIGQASMLGLGNQFLWPNLAGWGDIALPIGYNLTGFFGAMFAQQFLMTKQNAPRLNKIIDFLQIGFVTAAILPIIGFYTFSGIATALLGTVFAVTVIISGLIALNRKQSGALLFLTAWGILLIGVALLGLRTLNWVPTNILTSYGMQIGSAFEMLLLSFALASRINSLKRDKETAQNEALLSKEFAMNSLIDSEERLIKRIEERTKELSIANKQIRESDQLFRMLIEAIPDAIFLKDSQSRWLVTNEVAKKLFKLDEIEWQGKTELELASMRPSFRMAHERCLQDDNLAWQEAKLTFFDEIIIDEHGNKRYFEVRKNPSFNATGQPENLLIIGRDITDQKIINDKLRVAAIAFESREGMIVIDASNVILNVNQAFTSITGYSAEEVIGMKLQMLNLGRQDAPYYFEMWQSIKQTDSWVGEIFDQRKSGELYQAYLTITAVKGESGTVINYVVSLADITKRKQTEDEIQHLAYYDPLTNLPNRRLLTDRLNQSLASSMRSGKDGAILFLDLDHFKTLNDSLGHDVGDLLLQQVAERLTLAVREGDTVARLGGDEFVIMLEDLSESQLEAAAHAESIGEKIITIINQPFQFPKYEYHTTASIGIALFIGHELSHDELLKHADIAMYQAKKAGRNTLRFFDPKMQHAIHARVDLERELRKALDQQQLQLYYQVQVDVSERPFGAEALIRWLHPERGLISPFHFIPLAEETGLILPIGLWVLESACAQLKKWEQDPTTHDLKISINVSAKQFYQSNFVTQVKNAVELYSIDPMKLKLELTESMLLDNIEETIDKMIALKEIGIRFSLDDFGTGYSSLQYLKRLPLDQLKIDQSFVRDIGTDSSDQEIVRTIIAMAQSLRLDVIAEGVETNEQLGFLLNNACLHYQGYLFGKPVPIDEFEGVLRKSELL